MTTISHFFAFLHLIQNTLTTEYCDTEQSILRPQRIVVACCFRIQAIPIPLFNCKDDTYQTIAVVRAIFP